MCGKKGEYVLMGKKKTRMVPLRGVCLVSCKIEDLVVKYEKKKTGPRGG